MKTITLPYSKIANTDHRYAQARQDVVDASVRDQYTVAEHETTCILHNCGTVPSLLGLHVCPVCAAEQLGHRRTRLRVDATISEAILLEAERKLEGKK